MIDNGYLMIESFYYAIKHPPAEYREMMETDEAERIEKAREYYEGLDPREAQRVEAVRRMGEKVGVPLLEMMRYVARQFPYRSVKEKITPEWMKKRGMEKFPELVEVIEERGAAGEKWLSAQCREVVQFATGRIAWSDETDTMVEVPGVF